MSFRRRIISHRKGDWLPVYEKFERDEQILAVHAREKKYPRRWMIVAALVLGVVIGILIDYYILHSSPAGVHVINGIGSHGNAGKVILRAPKVKQQLSLAEMHLYHVLHVLHVQHLHVLHVRHLAHLARVRAMLRG